MGEDYLEISLTKLTWNGTDKGRAGSGLWGLSLDWKQSNQIGRTSDIKVHTVVDHLLRKSDSGSQIVVATLRELEARCLVNP